MKTNEQILDEMWYPDDEGKSIKKIEMAKQSEYGGVWYSEKGPIQIIKEGKLKPLL